MITSPLGFNNIVVADFCIFSRRLAVSRADIVKILTIVLAKVIKTPVIIGKPVKGNRGLTILDCLERFLGDFISKDAEKGKVRTLLIDCRD